MKIHYQDEYGESILTAYNKTGVPRIGETVRIGDEDYRVKNVTWIADFDDVIVEITQNLVRQRESGNGDSNRLAEMNRAILETNKRQDVQEKKHRLLNEQIVSIRSHINNKTRQERKDNDTR